MRLNRYRACFPAVLLLLSLMLCACGGQAVQSGAGMVTITDTEGNAVTVPEKVERIISTAPSATETLIHMGLAERLVAVDTYSLDIAGLPNGLPAYDMMSPDTESIAALKPDVVFATGMSMFSGDDPFAQLSELGIPVLYLPTATSIADIKADILFIGRVVGAEEAAAEVVGEMEAEIAAVTASANVNNRNLTVYFEVAAAPDICSFGSGTFLNEMLELLGAQNAFSDFDGWVSVSEEAVIERNPDIIFTNVGYIDDPVGEILGRNGWESVSAVKNRRVYKIDENASSRPNEYITKALSQIASALEAE